MEEGAELQVLYTSCTRAAAHLVDPHRAPPTSSFTAAFAVFSNIARQTFSSPGCAVLQPARAMPSPQVAQLVHHLYGLHLKIEMLVQGEQQVKQILHSDRMRCMHPISA